jgi:hypothetical protein
MAKNVVGSIHPSSMKEIFYNIVYFLTHNMCIFMILSFCVKMGVKAPVTFFTYVSGNLFSNLIIVYI